MRFEVYFVKYTMLLFIAGNQLYEQRQVFMQSEIPHGVAQSQLLALSVNGQDVVGETVLSKHESTINILK